jgi:hypothetical protein
MTKLLSRCERPIVTTSRPLDCPIWTETRISWVVASKLGLTGRVEFYLLGDKSLRRSSSMERRALGRKVGYSYKWNCLFNARSVSLRFLTFGVVTLDYARRRTGAPGRNGSRGAISLNRGALLAAGKFDLKSNAVCS